MKKIMKKVLTLVLVMAMLIVPMTVMAGDGTSEDNAIEVSANETITSDGTGQSVYYVYNAPVAADYEILVTGAIDSYGNSMIHPMTGMPFENYAMNGELYLYAYATNEVAFSLFDYESQELTITITMIEGTEIEESTGTEDGTTPETAITLTEDSPYISVPSAGMLYYKVAVDANAGYTLSLYNRVGAAFDLYLYNPRFGMYGYYGSSDNGLLEAMISTDSTEYIFAVGNPGDLELAVMVTLTKEGGDEEESTSGANGSIASPDTLIYDTDITTNLVGETYWYKSSYVAVNGKITVSFGNCSNGWSASVFKGETEPAEYVGWYSSDENTSFEVVVSENDVVWVGINNTAWEPGTVEFVATFAEGDFSTDVEGGEGEEGGEGVENEVNYENSLSPLVVGTDSYPTSMWYTYTVYEFAPTETGKYTFTSTDSLIGIVSTNGMWINVGSSTEAVDPEVVTETTFEWECTGVGQTIWVAALPDTNVATITIAQSEVVDDGPVWTEYENKVTPEEFTFDGDVENLVYIDVVDDVADVVVLGEDGFYHLNTVDGPIVYMNIGTVEVPYGMSISNILAYTGVKDGVNYVDYTNASLAYVEAQDATTGLYPLTEDLITIYKAYGAVQGWYDADTVLGFYIFGEDVVDPETAWMFACAYVEVVEDDTTVDTEEDTTVDTEEDTEDGEIADKGDATFTFITMTLFLGAAIVVTGIITKKRFA